MFNVIDLSKISYNYTGWLVLTILYVLWSQSVFSQQLPNDDVGKGTVIFRDHCSSCHGRTGEGDGPGAAALLPPPRDFTTGVYKFRSTSSGSMPTNEDLVKVIKRGLPGTWMPGWERLLSDDQILYVISYLKTLVSKEIEWQTGVPISSGPFPELPETDRTDGEALFLILECWSCHGLSGSGKGPSANTLKDYKDRKIAPTDLKDKHKYRAGYRAVDIRNSLLTGISGTPMPSYEGLFLLTKDDFMELEMNDIEYLSQHEIELIDRFIRKLPSNYEIEDLPEADLYNISLRDEWSLSQYIESIQRKNGLFKWLFYSNPEDLKLRIQNE